MGMLSDELKQIKIQINGHSWNTISIDDYRKMKERLFPFIENYQEDELLKTAKEVKTNLEILCMDNGNFFANTYNAKIEENKEDAFTKLVEVLKKI